MGRLSTNRPEKEEGKRIAASSNCNSFRYDKGGGGERKRRKRTEISFRNCTPRFMARGKRKKGIISKL